MALKKVTKLQGDIYYIEAIWKMQKLKSIVHSTDLNNFSWDLKMNHTENLNTWLQIVS